MGEIICSHGSDIMDCPFIGFESTYREIDDCVNFPAARVSNRIFVRIITKRENITRLALVIRKQDPVCSFYRYPAGDLC